MVVTLDVTLDWGRRHAQGLRRTVSSSKPIVYTCLSQRIVLGVLHENGISVSSMCFAGSLRIDNCSLL